MHGRVADTDIPSIQSRCELLVTELPHTSHLTPDIMTTVRNLPWSLLLRQAEHAGHARIAGVIRTIRDSPRQVNVLMGLPTPRRPAA